jgi:hypothetical protein
MPFTGDSSDSSDGEEGHNTTASQENTLRGGASRTSSGGDTTDQSSGGDSNASKSLRTSMQGLTLSPANKMSTSGSSPSKIKRGPCLSQPRTTKCTKNHVFRFQLKIVPWSQRQVKTMRSLRTHFPAASRPASSRQCRRFWRRAPLRACSTRTCRTRQLAPCRKRVSRSRDTSPSWAGNSKPGANAGLSSRMASSCTGNHR